LATAGQDMHSRTTAALVRDARIASMKLHPHGERELKGIGRVLLFELLHGEKRPQPLEAAAPPIQPSSGDAGDSEAPGAGAGLLEAVVRGRAAGRGAGVAQV